MARKSEFGITGPEWHENRSETLNRANAEEEDNFATSGDDHH
jgi:hypothetical protein